MRSPFALGMALVIAACTIWGLSPLFYKLLVHVPTFEILGHRTFWSFVFFAGFLALRGRLHEVRAALTDRVEARTLLVSTAVVSINWFFFILMVQLGRTTDASLGYFMSPLVSVLLGWLVLGERLGRWQGAAVGLAGFGVAALTYGLGVAPWVSLLLAVTFAYYGLIKKRQKSDALVSVTAEVCLLGPPALIALLWWGTAGHFGQDVGTSLLLIASGPMTAVPLMLYVAGARLVPLATLGMTQYLNPSLQFMLAVFLFAEPFTGWHAVTFACIWTALAIYSLAGLSSEKARRRA